MIAIRLVNISLNICTIDRVGEEKEYICFLALFEGEHLVDICGQCFKHFTTVINSHDELTLRPTKCIEKRILWVNILM